MSPVVAGSFQIYSAIIRVSGSPAEAKAFAELFDSRPASLPGRWVYEARPGHVAYSDDLWSAFVTTLLRRHETQHHRDLHTSSFGLLLWRTEVCISHDVEWILRLIHDAGLDFDAFSHAHASLHLPRSLRGTPFLEWLDDWGFAALTAAPPARFAHGELTALLEPVVRGLNDLLRFRDLLFDQPAESLTVREALELANRALDYLRVRCDLHSTWHFSTALALDSPWPRITLSPLETPFTTTWLLELSAWLSELVMIEVIGDPDGRLRDRWSRRLKGGAIAEALGVGPLADLGPTLRDTMAAAIQRSLSGACDPALPLTHDPYLEDAVPPVRFVATWDALFSDDEDPLPSPEEILLDYAFDDEISPREVYDGLAQAALNGPGGWGADSLKEGLEIYLLRTSPLVSFTPYRLQEFRRGFADRVARPLVWIDKVEPDAPGYIHSPLIEVYDDTMLTIVPAGIDGDDAGALYRSAVATGALAEVTAALLAGKERAETAIEFIDRFVEVHNRDALRYEPPRELISRDDLVPEWVPAWMVRPADDSISIQANP